MRHAEGRVGRNNINVIGFDRQIIGDLVPRHQGRAAQQLCERTLVLRIKMLYQHEPQAGVDREMF